MKDFYSTEAYEKVKIFVYEKNLFPKGCKVCAAVSGGADSVFMLFSLLGLREELGLELSVCHFNHMLRKEADSEEWFVKDLANKFNLPFYSSKKEVKPFAEKHSISVEMAARQLRYRFFNTLLEEKKADLIATAHNLSDSVETFFINIERGSGIRGLSGIPAKKGSFARPLLVLTHKEIRDALDKLGIEYKTDLSNFSEIYKRNSVRKEILPALERVFGENIYKSFARLFSNLESANKTRDFLFEFFLKENGCLGDGFLKIELEVMKKLPQGVFEEIVLSAKEKLTGSTYGFNSVLLREIRRFVNSFSNLKSLFPDKTLYAAKDKEFFYLLTEKFFFPSQKTIEKEGSYSIPERGQRLIVKRVLGGEIAENHSYVIIDTKKIPFPYVYSQIDFGKDYILFNGKKVNDLNNFLKKRGLNLFERKTVFVLKKQTEILFIPSIAVNDRLKFSEFSENLIKVYIEHCLR